MNNHRILGSKEGVKERPIIFSPAMVQAIRSGEKRQTRRVAKFVPRQPGADLTDSSLKAAPYFTGCKDGPFVLASMGGSCWNDRTFPLKCPYGSPGDRLWVRETWWSIPEPSIQQLRDGADTWPKVAYDADESEISREQNREMGWQKKSCLFLPRKFSRITLEITGVRVERVQDISYDDCAAEGITEEQVLDGCPAETFAILWDSINGKTFPWESNPWVWVVEFRRERL